MTEPPWEDPRRVLARHEVEPKRGMSQSFLVAREIVEKIADAVEVRPGELVVEIGPGVGTLTAALLRRGARVHGVELDRDMARVLRAELASIDRFTLTEGDATELDVGALARAEGSPVAVAGNIPYAVTGEILRNLVHHRDAIARAVIMVQREVRDRLLAAPGSKSYGALTVFTTAAFRVEPIVAVTQGCFYPPPKVASAVARLVPHGVPRAVETEMFRTVVRASFDARRKTLRNALLQRIDDAARVDAALQASGIDGRRRGETLTVEEFAALAAALG